MSTTPTADTAETEALMMKVMRALADRLSADIIGAGVDFGFALVLFERANGQPGPGWVTYCSNGQRDEVGAALLEIAGRIEKEPHPHG